VTARKFRDLNIEPAAREIETLQPVEALARYGDAQIEVDMPRIGLTADDEPSQIAAE
jgi:hypothetical protein